MKVLQKLHFANYSHLTPDNLLKMFNQNCYTPGQLLLSRKLYKSVSFVDLTKTGITSWGGAVTSSGQAGVSFANLLGILLS